MFAAIASSLGSNGRSRLNGRTVAGTADDGKLAANARRTFAHGQQAKVFAGGGRRVVLVRLESTAIVGYGEKHAIGLEREGDANGLRATMAHSVVDRLLRDAEQLTLGIG
jgi:hypothetical protein